MGGNIGFGQMWLDGKKVDVIRPLTQRHRKARQVFGNKMPEMPVQKPAPYRICVKALESIWPRRGMVHRNAAPTVTRIDLRREIRPDRATCCNMLGKGRGGNHVNFGKLQERRM
ncbi:hypothetical protein MASR2M74_25430 [Paracoccaceae bacterium]